MPLYGTKHVQLGPGQNYALFATTDTLTATVTSMSFLFLAATGAGTRGYTKTFQLILGSTGSATCNVQASLVDEDTSFVTVGTLTVTSGISDILTDIGNSLYYRLQLTAGAGPLRGLVNV